MEQLIQSIVALADSVKVKAKQYFLKTKDVEFYFFISKDGKLVFDIDAKSDKARDKFLSRVVAIADKAGVILRAMCAPKDHLYKSTFYTEMKKFQAELVKFGFEPDRESWTFMSRMPNPDKVAVARSVAVAATKTDLLAGTKDVKVGNTFLVQELKELDDVHKAYCLFNIPYLIDAWFHGKLMHKKMGATDLQLEQEIIEAFMFVAHHFSIPVSHPGMIYRITRLKDVDLEDLPNVRKVRPALRPVQSWTKSEDAAKVFFHDFFEKQDKETEDVARIGLSKTNYEPKALIDRDQLEVFAKALMKFVSLNADHAELGKFVLEQAKAKPVKGVRLVQLKPLESYGKWVKDITKFTLSPYIRKQEEIVLNIPRGKLLDIDECVPGEDL